jgi:hypothetical protein
MIRAPHGPEPERHDTRHPSRTRPSPPRDAGAAPGPAAFADRILPLQRAAGNAAVVRMLGRTPDTDVAPAHRPTGVPVQRALLYSAVSDAGNTGANVTDRQRVAWLKGLINRELAAIFQVPNFNEQSLAAWKTAHQNIAVDYPLGLIKYGLKDINWSAAVTKADIASMNRILHDIDTTVNSANAAPHAIGSTLIGNEFTFVNESLRTALKHVDPTKDGDVYDKMRIPYKGIVDAWRSAMGPAGRTGPGGRSRNGPDADSHLPLHQSRVRRRLVVQGHPRPGLRRSDHPEGAGVRHLLRAGG